MRSCCARRPCAAWEVYGRRGITEAQIHQEMDRQRTSGRVYDDQEKKD